MRRYLVIIITIIFCQVLFLNTSFAQNRDFNLDHPELQIGEVFVANMTASQYESELTKNPAFRMGIQAYNTRGETLEKVDVNDGFVGLPPKFEKVYPVFLNLVIYDADNQKTVDLCFQLTICNNRHNTNK